MRMQRYLAATAGLIVLALPAQALGGTVVRSATAITYEATDGADDKITLGTEAGMEYISAERGVTSASCTQTDPNRVDCLPTPAFTVFMLGFADSVNGELVTSGATLEAHGRGGDDSLTGTRNADKLYGEDGGDSLTGLAGDDVLDGGPGADYLYDGPGDDTVSGGPNDDTIHAGPGRDVYNGGDGADQVDYSARTAALTITLDGVADDGEVGEGDNVGADIERATGGSGPDRIVAGAVDVALYGGAGNDTITGSKLQDRVEGNEGDDTIDVRDGNYDSVDCGPGTDTILADIGDSATNCEVAPDRDGDGFANEADCAPDNAAINPTAGEIYGNAIDEDCKNGPGYFKVDAGFAYKTLPRKSPQRLRFLSLRVTSIQAGDTVELRCKGKGCPLKVKKQTATAGKPTISLVPLLKRRFLRVGTVLELRILRANQIGKVARLTIVKGPDVKQKLLCVGVGTTTPGTCPKS